MVQRRSLRKVGLRRIDAALAGLLPLGFSKKLVVKTIEKLLEVYGGDGWAFIEEASYKVVIDTILEEQEECLAKTDDHSAEGCKALEFPSDDAGSNPCVQEVSATEQTSKPRDIVAWKDVSCVNTDSLIRMSKIKPTGSGGGKSEICLLDQGRRDNGLIRKREPCYGWISDDDDDGTGGSTKPPSVKIFLKRL